MAFRKNPDGSITVGILPEVKTEPKAEAAKAAKPAAKKPTAKKK